MPNEVPNRLEGKTVPDALPEAWDLGSPDDAYKPTNEMTEDLIGVIRRYAPAVSRSEIIGSLMRLAWHYDQVWVEQDRRGVDDGESV